MEFRGDSMVRRCQGYSASYNRVSYKLNREVRMIMIIRLEGVLCVTHFLGSLDQVFVDF